MANFNLDLIADEQFYGLREHSAPKPAILDPSKLDAPPVRLDSLDIFDRVTSEMASKLIPGVIPKHPPSAADSVDESHRHWHATRPSLKATEVQSVDEFMKARKK